MAKSLGKVILVPVKVESATPDRVQWKPYATNLVFNNLWIEVPVPDDADHVASKKGDEIVLTLKGYATLLANYVSAIEEMHNAYIQSFQRYNPKF